MPDVRITSQSLSHALFRLCHTACRVGQYGLIRDWLNVPASVGTAADATSEQENRRLHADQQHPAQLVIVVL